MFVILVIFLIGSKAYDDDDLVQEVVEDAEDIYSEDPAESTYEQPPRPRRPFVHPLTDMPPAAEDIYTSYYFPKHPDLRLPIGEEVTVLCHVENEGEVDYNVSAIMGSLNNPFQFDFFVQNFTLAPIATPVPAGVEFTFAYTFQLHPALEPNEFALAATVFYDDGIRAYSSTFFNATVEVYHAKPAFTPQDILKMVVTLAATVLFGYMGFNLAFGKKSAPAALKGKGTAAKDKSKDDWSSEFLGNTSGKKSPTRSKKGGSKKK